jgi:hypothetical protein
LEVMSAFPAFVKRLPETCQAGAQEKTFDQRRAGYSREPRRTS